MQNVLHEMRATGQQKVAMLCDESVIESTVVMYWGMPYESILLSGIDGDKINRTFLGVSPERYQHIGVGADTMRHTILYPWGVIPVSDINPRYFRLDTTQPYTYWDCDRSHEVLRRKPTGNAR